MNAIYLDMDGTIADLYAVENWEDKLEHHDVSPYQQAPALCNMSLLARTLNQLQKKGFRIGIISWLSKNATADYDKEVINAKLEWLRLHLSSVHFDEVKIVPYGTPKSKVAATDGLLIDDEHANRKEWNEAFRYGIAISPRNMIKMLRNFL